MTVSWSYNTRPMMKRLPQASASLRNPEKSAPETVAAALTMSPLLLPFRLVLLVFAGWVNGHQLDVIKYLQEENRVLKERLGGRRLRFTDAERADSPEKRKHSGAMC
jgi:hypothetical protein